MLTESKSHLKILGSRSVTWNKFNTENPQILGTSVQNLVVTAICRLAFAHPWRRSKSLCTSWHV